MITLTGKQNEAVKTCVTRFQRGQAYTTIAGYA